MCHQKIKAHAAWAGQLDRPQQDAYHVVPVVDKVNFAKSSSQKRRAKPNAKLQVEGKTSLGPLEHRALLLTFMETAMFQH